MKRWTGTMTRLACVLTAGALVAGCGAGGRSSGGEASGASDVGITEGQREGRRDVPADRCGRPRLQRDPDRRPGLLRLRQRQRRGRRPQDRVRRQGRRLRPDQDQPGHQRAGAQGPGLRDARRPRHAHPQRRRGLPQQPEGPGPVRVLRLDRVGRRPRGPAADVRLAAGLRDRGQGHRQVGRGEHARREGRPVPPGRRPGPGQREGRPAVPRQADRQGRPLHPGQHRRGAAGRRAAGLEGRPGARLRRAGLHRAEPAGGDEARLPAEVVLLQHRLGPDADRLAARGVLQRRREDRQAPRRGAQHAVHQGRGRHRRPVGPALAEGLGRARQEGRAHQLRGLRHGRGLRVRAGARGGRPEPDP